MRLKILAILWLTKQKHQSDDQVSVFLQYAFFAWQDIGSRLAEIFYSIHL